MALPGVGGKVLRRADGGTAAAKAALDQYNTNSKLSRNMLEAGNPVAKGQHCHHIVAENAAKAAPARQRLKELGIDIDNPANGVGLPPRFHHGMHDQNYYDDVNARSQGWRSPEEALADLADIAEDLRRRAGLP